MAPQSDGWRERSSRRRRRQTKSVASRCRHFLREFTAFMFTNVGVIGLVVGYIIAGAFLFAKIEESSATEKAISVRKMRDSTANKLWLDAATHLNGVNASDWMRRVGDELQWYQTQVVYAVRSGWDGSDGDHSRWTFSGSFLYSLTVITTIGYGNISPKTDLGKLATIGYAMFGMPLFLLYLTNIGDIFARAFKWFYVRVCLCRSCPGLARRRLLTVLHQQVLEGSLSPEDFIMVEQMQLRRMARIEKRELESRSSSKCSTCESSTSISSLQIPELDISTITVPHTVCVLIMVGYILFGAMLFRLWEDWNSIDGAYFCFISLTSIGFGDIVPGDRIYAAKPMDASFIVCSLYLLLGMALIAMCFNLMQEQVMQQISSAKRTLRRIFRCER